MTFHVDRVPDWQMYTGVSTASRQTWQFGCPDLMRPCRLAHQLVLSVHCCMFPIASALDINLINLTGKECRSLTNQKFSHIYKRLKQSIKNKSSKEINIWLCSNSFVFICLPIIRKLCSPLCFYFQYTGDNCYFFLILYHLSFFQQTY